MTAHTYQRDSGLWTRRFSETRTGLPNRALHPSAARYAYV
jgi:hypothetical protein